MNYLDLLLWVWAIFNGRVIFKGTEWASQVVLVVKNPPVNAENPGLISGSGKSLEEEMATHSSMLDSRIL